MNAVKTLALMEKYMKCPNCGNGYVSNGEGKLIVEDEYFYRSCKCGWEIKVDENDRVID